MQTKIWGFMIHSVRFTAVLDTNSVPCTDHRSLPYPRLVDFRDTGHYVGCCLMPKIQTDEIIEMLIDEHLLDKVTAKAKASPYIPPAAGGYSGTIDLTRLNRLSSSLKTLCVFT